jgi:NTP pyrophosphatase (non-canonical NTP hydrolase)
VDLRKGAIVNDSLKQTEQAIRAELSQARRKFTTNKQLLHAFVEEAGEVTKAMLDLQQGKCSSYDVRKEIVQAAAMAFRLLEEGDPEFPEFISMGPN